MPVNLAEPVQTDERDRPWPHTISGAEEVTVQAIKVRLLSRRLMPNGGRNNRFMKRRQPSLSSHTVTWRLRCSISTDDAATTR